MASTDVYHYFREKLGRWPTDETLRTVDCSSQYGAWCVRAIDAAATLLDCIRVADTVNDHQAVMTAVERAITYGVR